MKRYLFYFSYLGTRFRGLQKQFEKGVPVFPERTVQGALEFAIHQLKPLNQPKIYPVSRTDQGVHALKTAAHCDLDFTEDKEPYQIVHTVNSYLTRKDFDIRVLDVERVPDEFSARYSVVRKKYLYRFAVIKPEFSANLPGKKHILPVPIVEKNRCHFIFEPEFNYSLAADATKLLIGTKDFTAFMSRVKFYPEVVKERNIESLVLEPGEPLSPQTPESNYFNYWNVTCSGKSFLYKQVRRTVGVLIGVGLGKLSIADVEQLFNPEGKVWNDRAAVVPGHGLYLVNVEYRPEDVRVPDALLLEEKEGEEEKLKVSAL